MNHVVTSKEEILEEAKKIIAQGSAQLSMRTLARQCGISVGSIYNYFPSREDLVVEVISQVWEDIFHPVMCGMERKNFLELVEDIQKSVQEGRECYPHFFEEHTGLAPNKEKGRSMMSEALCHMRRALCKALKEDQEICGKIWSDDFKEEDFADFVLEYMCKDIMRGEDKGRFLKELILRAVYQKN